MEPLFARFHEQLAAQGYAARAGQMIDATFVEIPRQRNNRDENAEIKAGVTPEAWQADNKAAKNKLQIKGTLARRARLWRAGADGWARCAHDRDTASAGQDRDDESGLQHTALGSAD